MSSTFAISPIQHPRTKFSGPGSIDPRVTGSVRRRRKETVNERVEQILRGALRDAEEEELQGCQGGPEARGRALQRSHQLASLYTTSTDNKFLRARAKRGVSLHESKAQRNSESRGRSRVGSDYSASMFGEGNEIDEGDDDTLSVGNMAQVSPHKSSLSWGDVTSAPCQSPVSITTSPVKPAKPWYGCTSSRLNEQLPPGLTLDAKIRRYGARGTAKLVHGWRSQETLAPLSPILPVDEFVEGLSGSPSLWPPETFHPTGSHLHVTMTRCPSSPIAVSIEIDDQANVEPCQAVINTHGALQLKAARKLQRAYRQEVQVAQKERRENQREMAEWQRRTLHFEPSSELADHREQRKTDPQHRHRRTQASAIVQTPGYSPEKQRGKESSELRNNRFKLRWRSFARLLDAMRRTPCRRPVLQDMEKLFTLARELSALNALGTCLLSRAQFTMLVTREFPLCDLKHVNRLFSSYDWEIRDSVDARIVLGTLRAMRIQQGEPVELVCASLRDFDVTTDSNSKTADDYKAVVSDGICLAKSLSLCCATGGEEKEMAARADVIWTKILAWQRQILSRRQHGGARHNVWKPNAGTWSIGSSSVVSCATESENYSGEDYIEREKDEESIKDDSGEDEEETIEEISHLIRLVDEACVPVRRIRTALKRERETLELFTQQLLQRRHECLVEASTRSPRIFL